MDSNFQLKNCAHVYSRYSIFSNNRNAATCQRVPFRTPQVRKHSWNFKTTPTHTHTVKMEDHKPVWPLWQKHLLHALMATLSGCVYQPNRHFEFHFRTSNHCRSKTSSYTHTPEQSSQGWKSWTCSHVSKEAWHAVFLRNLHVTLNTQHYVGGKQKWLRN